MLDYYLVFTDSYVTMDLAHKFMRCVLSNGGSILVGFRNVYVYRLLIALLAIRKGPEFIYMETGTQCLECRTPDSLTATIS